jgi:hypothetical protein
MAQSAAVILKSRNMYYQRTHTEQQIYRFKYSASILSCLSAHRDEWIEGVMFKEENSKVTHLHQGTLQID